MRSGLFDLLEPGDSIVVYRGLDIASILPEGVSMNIPPFWGDHVQFDEMLLAAARKIASLRIHVERAIQRMKNLTITLSAG